MCAWLKYNIEVSIYHFIRLPINTNQGPVTVYKQAPYKVLTTFQHSRLSTSDGSWEYTFFFLSFTSFEILFMCGFMKTLGLPHCPQSVIWFRDNRCGPGPFRRRTQLKFRVLYQLGFIFRNILIGDINMHILIQEQHWIQFYCIFAY